MENQFVAPVGEISMNGQTFTAPSNFESREKNPNIQMLPVGNNLGRIYAIVDLGTHMESFSGAPAEPKRKVKVIFEHPQLKQQFYMDDPNLKSTVSSFESTFNVGPQSRLRELIHAVEGRALSDEEANKYNLANLLGKNVNVVIEHNQSKKDKTKFYEKIKFVGSANGMAVPPNFQPENPYLFFIIDKDGRNFLTKNFADLTYYLRKRVLESQEALQYAAKGGQFAENPKPENNGQQQPQQQNVAQPIPQQAPSAPVAPQAPGTPAPAPVNNFSPYENERIKLNSQQWTIEQWLAGGWTEDALVQNGHAIFKGVSNAPSAPQPLSPQPPVQQQSSSMDFSNDEEDDLPF